MIELNDFFQQTVVPEGGSIPLKGSSPVLLVDMHDMVRFISKIDSHTETL